MKVLVEQIEQEGLEALLGKQVLLICSGYFYHGKLVGVNSSCVKLENPSIVYETGSWSATDYKDIQRLPTKYHYVTTASIESFGESLK